VLTLITHYKRAANNRPWYERNQIVLARDAGNRIVPGIGRQSDVKKHLCAALRALNLHTDV